MLRSVMQSGSMRPSAPQLSAYTADRQPQTQRYWFQVMATPPLPRLAIPPTFGPGADVGCAVSEALVCSSRLHRSRCRRYNAGVVRAAAAEELVDPDPSFRIEKVLHSAFAPMRVQHVVEPDPLRGSRNLVIDMCRALLL